MNCVTLQADENKGKDKQFIEEKMTICGKDFNEMELEKKNENYFDQTFFDCRVRQRHYYEPIFWIFLENDEKELCENILSEDWGTIYEERRFVLKCYFEKFNTVEEYDEGFKTVEEARKNFEKEPTFKALLQQEKDIALQKLSNEVQGEKMKNCDLRNNLVRTTITLNNTTKENKELQKKLKNSENKNKNLQKEMAQKENHFRDQMINNKNYEYFRKPKGTSRCGLFSCCCGGGFEEITGDNYDEIFNNSSDLNMDDNKQSMRV